ncbi:MAG: low molecular weight protein tyrosine phosphatase family protein [Solimonas sp.]
MRVLFVCGRNRRRSPTAEQYFADWPGIETASAGLSPEADIALTADLVGWAELICVMESARRRKLSQRFGAQLKGRRVACLNIPDDDEFMDPALIRRLEASVPRLLRTR